MHALPEAVLAALPAAATALGMPCGEEFLCLGEALVPWLGGLVRAGGSWSPAGGALVWSAEVVLASGDELERLEAAGLGGDLGPARLPRHLCHATGLVRVQLGEHQALAAGMLLPMGTRAREQCVVLAGASRTALTELVRAVHAVYREPRLRVWGGGSRTDAPAAVAEADVVLAAAIKADLLGSLDRFWRSLREAGRLGLPARRGLLLVGPPGTGKTQAVRLLLTRYPDVPAHLFVPMRRHPGDDPFRDMLAHLQHRRQPAMVVLEDLDRLAESGTVTPEFLLNCLDGLLELPAPVLWIATSNDPAGLAENLLDRPGRFDRVVVFSAPAVEERAHLVTRFSVLPLDAASLGQAATASDGLTGAHLREACASATLVALDREGTYGPALLEEIARIRGQHTQARDLDRALRSTRAGFRPAMGP